MVDRGDEKEDGECQESVTEHLVHLFDRCGLEGLLLGTASEPNLGRLSGFSFIEDAYGESPPPPAFWEAPVAKRWAPAWPSDRRRPLWSLLVLSWGLLGASWGLLGGLLGASGPLGGLWGLLEASLAVLERSWPV